MLTKYNGEKFTDSVRAGHQLRKRYTITKLPRFLVLHLDRFKANNFYVEKNPTIVNFPVKNLELRDHFALDLAPGADEDAKVTKYDLVANICHDSPPGQGKEGQKNPLEGGSYRVHVQHKATEQWYEIQDLHVQETMPQLIGLSESNIMIYERKKPAARAAADAAAELRAELDED